MESDNRAHTHTHTFISFSKCSAAAAASVPRSTHIALFRIDCTAPIVRTQRGWRANVPAPARLVGLGGKTIYRIASSSDRQARDNDQITINITCAFSMHMFTIDIYVYIVYKDIYSWNITIHITNLNVLKKRHWPPDSCDGAVPFASYYIQIDEVRRRCGDVDHLISVYVAIYIIHVE